ncbi:MAG: nucleotidyltransferase domain-containing protein [Bacteroidota bacterium]
MKSVAETLRLSRKTAKLTLQQVSVAAKIDVGILSKMERELRPISMEQLELLCKIYKLNFQEQKKNLTAEHIVAFVAYEQSANEILQIAEQKLAYATKATMPLNKIVRELKNVFRKFPQIESAWVFGSYARGEMTSKSDVDVVITVGKGFTYFQLADVQYQAENKLGIKVDIGFKKSLDKTVSKNAEKDMKLIYGNGE